MICKVCNLPTILPIWLLVFKHFKSIENWEKNLTWQFFAAIGAWGPSTTTWTKFYPILLSSLPRVDNCGHFTWYLPYESLCHWTKCAWTIYWPPSPSSGPPSYWSTPKTIIAKVPSIICIRRPVPSTDQAIPSCCYFRISWILMEQRCFYFFVPSGFWRASEASNNDCFKK